MNTDLPINEVWRDVIGYEGLYQVSDSGHVMSLRTGRILKEGVDKETNIRNIGLYNAQGVRKSYTIHQLVMRTFVGECPPDMEINHDDGDRSNNTLSNLEYCTHQYNIRHAIRTGLYKSPTGENAHASKLTQKKVDEIRASYIPKRGMKTALAKQYGVTAAAIHKIVTRKTWKHTPQHTAPAQSESEENS